MMQIAVGKHVSVKTGPVRSKNLAEQNAASPLSQTRSVTD